MAALIIPPGYAQIAWKVTNATVGRTAIWTIGAKLAGSSWSSTERAELFNDVSAALKPIWDSNVTQTGFHALVGNDGPAIAYDVTGSVAGTRPPTQMFPPQVSYLIKKSTGFAGRSFRGRSYLPFVEYTETDENGRISGTQLTRFQTAVVGLQNAGLSTSGGGINGWYLLHRSGTPGAGEGPTLIQDLLASTVVATQRRRLVR